MQSIPSNLISLIAFAIVMLVAMLLLALKNRFTRMFNELSQKIEQQSVQLLESQAHILRQQSKMDESARLISELTRENEQVSKHLEHRIKQLNEQIKGFDSKIEQLSSQQPEDRLYSRALKLAELGADIEEIVRECDIPRAEAEMLLAVHRQKLAP